jgi:hypothetical protein
VTTPRKRPGDRHKRGPIAFRPPADDGEWLEQHAREIGKPVNRLLSELLAAYRSEVEGDATASLERPLNGADGKHLHEG